MLLFMHGKSWGIRMVGHGPLLGAHIGAEEDPGWAQVATLAFLVSPSRISHIAGVTTKRGMSWVSPRGVGQEEIQSLLQISTIILLTT